MGILSAFLKYKGLKKGVQIISRKIKNSNTRTGTTVKPTKKGVR